MAGAYKVRLEDGVEVGPLDVEMLRSWWQQGMLNRDTKVKAQGSKSWRRLGEAVDIQDWGAAGGSGARRETAADDDVDVDVYEDDDAGPQTWRTYVASGIFFLCAAGAGYLAFFPDRWLAALGDMPWREIALSSALLGLLLVRGWEAMRKLVRVLVALLAFSLFPLAGFVVFRGIQLPTAMILVSAWAMGSGLFFFLAGRRLSWTSIALSLFWIVVGAAGIAYFGFVPPVTAARAAATEAVAPAVPAAPPAPSVAAVMQDVPILTRRAAEAVLARGATTPAEAFRFAYSLATSGLAVLSADERKELGETTSAAYAALAPHDRDRLATYMERVRTGAVTLPQEDRDMSALMRDAVLKLPEAQRARLQALYEKAVTAAP